MTRKLHVFKRKASGSSVSDLYILTVRKIADRSSLTRLSNCDVKMSVTGKKTKGVEKKVSFDYVDVREYERILGDNPGCSSGPPIAIGWHFLSETRLDVSKFEEAREPRRRGMDLHLSQKTRQKMLEQLGYSQVTIAMAVLNMEDIKEHRLSSAEDKVDGLKRSSTRNVVEKFRRKMNGTVIQTLRKLAKLSLQSIIFKLQNA